MEYKDSPIEWHTNPMYIEDMEHRSSLEYGISPLWNNKDSNSSTNNNTGGAGGTSGIHLQPRSTSRTSIYSTTSSSDQEGSSAGNNTVMLSTLEPVSSTRSTGQQQSLDEIEMISQVDNTATTNGTSGDRKTTENDQY